MERDETRAKAQRVPKKKETKPFEYLAPRRDEIQFGGFANAHRDYDTGISSASNLIHRVAKCYIPPAFSNRNFSFDPKKTLLITDTSLKIANRERLASRLPYACR
jgi:hypothetical protein